MLRILLALLALMLAGPAVAGWKVAETAHFRVHSDGPESRVRTQAALLEDFRALLVLMTGREPPADQPKLDVYIVDSIGEADPFNPSPRLAAGYYKAGDRQIAAFVEDGDLARRILLHEYAHHFMLGQASLAYPAWYVEGFADYFAHSTFRPERIEFGLANPNQLGWLQNAGWMPLRQLLARGVRNRSGPEVAMFYAQSWLLTHYLLRTPGMKDRLTAYLRAHAEGADPVEAFRTHIDPDLDAFQARLRNYISGRSLTFTRFTRPKATPAAVTVRDHPPAAEPMLLQLVALEYGIRASARADALAAVRAAAARFPGDPLAERTLALAELRLGDDRVAHTRLEALLAASPRDPDLLRWKAESLVDNPRLAAEARLKEARQLLVRAWQASPGDWRVLHAWVRLHPMPLGERQMEALLKARELAPQVQTVVMDAAIALAHEGRLAEAAFVLEPVAFSPHGGPLAARAASLIEEARDGNREGFLALLRGPAPPEVAAGALPGDQAAEAR